MPPATPPSTAVGPSKPTAGPSSPPPSGIPPRAPSATAPASPPKSVVPKITRAVAKTQPPRLILNAVEGWGKTSFLAFMPAPLIIMARGETGYRTLVNQRRAPELDNVLVEDWGSLLALLDDLIAQATLPYKTIGLDAAGGFERLCHELVCARDFEGKWDEKGFTAFQRGYDVSVTDWLQLETRLDKLHDRGIAIVLLSHCKVRNFKNPMGTDFDRYVSDLHEKTWAKISKWADCVLFGNFISVVKEKQGKGKGIGGADRVLYAERRDAYDAKNRYGLPDAVSLPDDPALGWASIADYFNAPALTTNPA